MDRDPNQLWIENLRYEIALWTEPGRLEEVIARIEGLDIAYAAYQAAILKHPDKIITLREKARIIRKRVPNERMPKSR